MDAANDVTNALQHLIGATECSEFDVKDIPDIYKAHTNLHTGLETLKKGLNDRNIVISETKNIANNGLGI